MTPEEQAGAVLGTIISYLQQVGSVETEEERDEVAGKLEDAIKALDAITFPDRAGQNEDHEYEVQRDFVMEAEA